MRRRPQPIARIWRNVVEEENVRNVTTPGRQRLVVSGYRRYDRS